MRIRSAIVRPWLKAGLSVLLVENTERKDELCGRGAAVQDAQSVSSESIPSALPKGKLPEEKAGKIAWALPKQEKKEQHSQAVFQKTEAQNRTEEHIPAEPQALAVENWPESWLALKNRRPLPARPLVLWTYAGLGDDLTGKVDEKRRQVIVQMLMALGHPGGTHVFWPCDLTGESRERGALLFWSGVTLLNPRVLLLFGSDARDILSMPRSLGPLCQIRRNGRLIFQLKRPELLAEEGEFRNTLAFLSSALQFCTRGQVK